MWLRAPFIILTLGVIALLVGMPIFLRNIEIRNNSSETTATVTYVGRRPQRVNAIGSGAPFIYIQYIADEVEYNSRVYFRSDGIFSVGDEVQIHYSLRNPRNARLADPFRMRYDPDFIFFIFGIVAMAVFVWIFYLCIRGWKNDRVATKRITEFRRE